MHAHAAWRKASEVDVWPWRCMCDTSLVHGGTLFFSVIGRRGQQAARDGLSAADEDDHDGGRTMTEPEKKIIARANFNDRMKKGTVSTTHQIHIL